MLDDIQLAYYNSDVKNLIYRQSPKSDSECVRREDANFVFADQYRRMKERALFSKHQLNLTRGVHIQQNMGGCELQDNDIPGPFHSWDAFDGVNNAKWQFSMQQKSLQAEGLWSHIERKSLEVLFTNLFSPICIRSLKRCLHMRKNDVMRKVKPRVRLLQKTLPDSGGAKVTCLATGFYPRHINLTLLRDGQPVSDHQITGGELLPNGDGTYQKRKSLEVSAE
ncbi:hypothetical protein AALO_G00305150, partial [Alosa alosa]